MKKLLLIFAIFLFCFPVWGQEDSGDIKEQLLSGLDQLEGLMLGMEQSLIGLQGEVQISQQIIDDMASIQWAQAMYLNQLRGQVDDMAKIDEAKSRYIILMQTRQRNYRIALAVGIPVGVAVGVVGGILISHYF